MTTIATDGKSMAADGMVTERDHVCRTDYMKVRRISGGRIVGCAGNAYNWDPFVEWLDKRVGDPPKVDEGIGVIVLHPGGAILQYDEHGRSFPEKAPCAIGSGTRFALAAMDLGKSPGDAVRYACTRDIHSGGEVTELTLEQQIKAAA